MIIDFHTHIFPDAIAERAIITLEENTLRKQGIMLRSDESGNLPSSAEQFLAVIPATLSALKKSMKTNRLDGSVVLPIATTLTQSKSINEFAAQINNRDGIYSFGSLHPFQEDWESVLYDIKEKGLRGIKLHPEYQQFYVDCPESLRVLKKCEELDLIVVLHAGNDVGVEPPAHCMPQRLRSVLDYVSGEKIVAAHLGGWSAWDEVEEYLVGTPVYLDTAYTVFCIEQEQLLRIIRNHGSEKILFATDSPWQHQGKTAEFLSSIGLSKKELSDIMGENAKKLLKIC